jgi:hypothetical protein
MKLSAVLVVVGLVVALAACASATDYKAVAREYIDNNDGMLYFPPYNV